jgi:hypothetical protein
VLQKPTNLVNDIWDPVLHVLTQGVGIDEKFTKGDGIDGISPNTFNMVVLCCNFNTAKNYYMNN